MLQLRILCLCMMIPYSTFGFAGGDKIINWVPTEIWYQILLQTNALIRNNLQLVSTGFRQLIQNFRKPRKQGGTGILDLPPPKCAGWDAIQLPSNTFAFMKQMPSQIPILVSKAPRSDLSGVKIQTFDLFSKETTISNFGTNAIPGMIPGMPIPDQTHLFGDHLYIVTMAANYLLTSVVYNEYVNPPNFQYSLDGKIDKTHFDGQYVYFFEWDTQDFKIHLVDDHAFKRTHVFYFANATLLQHVFFESYLYLYYFNQTKNTYVICVLDQNRNMHVLFEGEVLDCIVKGNILYALEAETSVKVWTFDLRTASAGQTTYLKGLKAPFLIPKMDAQDNLFCIARSIERMRTIIHIYSLQSGEQMQQLTLPFMGELDWIAIYHNQLYWLAYLELYHFNLDAPHLAPTLVTRLSKKDWLVDPDGSYAYGYQHDKISIIDLHSGCIASRIQLEDYPKELYLYNKTLYLLSQRLAWTGFFVEVFSAIHAMDVSQFR